MGEQPGDFLNTFDVPSSTLFDAALYYTLKGWRVSMTAKNLADKRYVAFCQGPDDCHRGDPLSVMATVQYTWK